MSSSFDVIIIGGGIMGCSTALELANRGVKVALFEKSNIGEGPTGESSAIIRQHYSNELTARMALYSLRVFQDFPERIGGESGFTQTGFIVIVEEKDRKGLEQNILLQRQLGIKTEMLPADELQKLMPTIARDDLLAMAYEEESGYADPYLTVNAFAKAAKHAGARIFQNTEVKGIQLDRGKVTGIESNGEVFHSDKILNAAGAWGNMVARMAGVELPVNACRVQVAFFRRPEGHSKPHPVVADFINATYFRPETGGLTLVGLIDPSEANAVVNPDKFKRYLDDEFVLEAGERLVRRYPPMERSESTGGYASLYAITPDWHPVIDEAIEDSGFYICTGFSGHGFKLGPAVGVLAADMLTEASDPLFDPHMFRLSRFAENQPIRGQYEYSIVG